MSVFVRYLNDNHRKNSKWWCADIIYRSSSARSVSRDLFLVVWPAQLNDIHRVSRPTSKKKIVMETNNNLIESQVYRLIVSHCQANRVYIMNWLSCHLLLLGIISFWLTVILLRYQQLICTVTNLLTEFIELIRID